MNIQATPPRTPAEQAIIDTFAREAGNLPGDARTSEIRGRLMAGFSTSGLPSRRIEAWHYTDMRTLVRALPKAGEVGPCEALAPLVSGSTVLPVLQGEAGEPAFIEGAHVQPFMDQLASGYSADLLAERGSDDLIGRLNGAFVSDGFALEVGDDVELALPVEIQAVQDGGHAHTRFPCRFGKNAKATIVERQAAAGDRTAFSSSISSLELDDGAEVVWVLVQSRGGEDTHLGQFSATLGAKARLTLFIVNAGGKLVRQEVHVETTGEGAHFDLRGINLLDGDTHTDVTMTLGHNVPETTSLEILRNVVLGKARGVFQGQIQVAQIAQKTDAQMSCNTLLLSDEGEFAAKPELEIFADDVVCGHGATVVDIDPTQLFYLMARGVSEKSARSLLINGFVDELVDELENEELADTLRQIVADWLAEHG